MQVREDENLHLPKARPLTRGQLHRQLKEHGIQHRPGATYEEMAAICRDEGIPLEPVKPKPPDYQAMRPAALRKACNAKGANFPRTAKKHEMLEWLRIRNEHLA